MKEEIMRRLGEGYEVIEVTVPKNNGIVCHGYSVRKSGTNTGVNIYTDDVPEEKIVEYVVEHFHELEKRGLTTPKKMLQGKEIDDVMNKEFILANVYPSLINHDSNVGMLDELYHEPFLDLEIIYRVRLDNNSSFVLKNDIFKAMDISEEEVRESAMKNIEDFSFTINANKLFGNGNDDEVIPMFIVTTKWKFRGAGAIFDNNLLDAIKNTFGTDAIYLLPSSVDEMIVTYAPEGESEENVVKHLRNMVKSVNKTIPEEEFLSDNVYVYRGEKVEVA